MSQYATFEEFLDLGLPDEAVAELTSGVVDYHIQAASEYCDSILGIKYVVPITVPSLALSRAALNIAVDDVLARRGYDPTAFNALYSSRAQAAKDWLALVAEGRGVIPGATLIPSGSGNIVTSAQVFSNDPRGWYDD